MNFIYLADRKEAISTIAGWYYHQWGHLHNIESVERSEEILKDYLNRDKIPLIILALDDDEVVGTVQLKYYEMDIFPQKEHWLGGVYVPQQHRGKRIAEGLVQHATEVAKLYGVDLLYLQTEKLDGGLYKKLGWKPVEKVIYRNKQVLVMKKKL